MRVWNTTIAMTAAKVPTLWITVMVISPVRRAGDSGQAVQYNTQVAMTVPKRVMVTWKAASHMH